MAPPATQSRKLLHFSLRTLLLFVLLIGSSGALYLKFPAWVLEGTLEYDGYIHSASFSPDGQHIVTAGADYTVPFESPSRGFCAIWSVARKQVLVRLVGHDSYVYTASFSPDGLSVVSAGADRLEEVSTVRVWDAASGKEMVKIPFAVDISKAAFSPDGRLIAVSGTNTAQVWNPSGERVVKLPVAGHVYSTVFSPNGLHIVTAESEATARIWEMTTGKVQKTFWGHTGSVWYAEFSPNGSRLATASYDGTARIWNVATGQELMRLDHPDHVNTAVFSPDGQRLLTSCENDAARIWDVSTGKHLAEFRAPKVARAAAYSPDGRRLVVTGGEIAYIWLNQRPEHTWGFMVLPEFWLTLTLLLATLRSLIAD